jgi:hypothetical protein
MIEIAIMLGLTILQNASFTLVSRARNRKSLLYHGAAATCSNGIWLLVFRNLSMNLSNTSLMITYVIGAVTGSVLMHWFAMKFLEKPKKKQWYDMMTSQDIDMINYVIMQEKLRLHDQNKTV